MSEKIFIDRRKGKDRREEGDLCEGLDVDIYHRKRRKNPDRRAERSLYEDYEAFIAKDNQGSSHSTPPPSQHH